MERKTYIIRDNNGKLDQKKGTLCESESGLFYFLTDYNKAKKFDSIPRYKKGTGLLELLRFVDYKTKKHIDDPIKQ